MNRLRGPAFTLVLAPALILTAGGIGVASWSRLALRAELDRHVATRAVEYVRWQRSSLRDRLTAAPGLLAERAAELAIERYSFYEDYALSDRAIRVGTFPLDSAPVSLRAAGERSESMLAAAQRGTALVDLARVGGRVRWLAYLPDGARLTVALITLDPRLAERFGDRTGYELALYTNGTRVPPAWGDWPDELTSSLRDSLANFDRALSARLAGRRFAAAAIKDFDDWDPIGAALVRPGPQASSLPGFPLLPVLALLVATATAAALLWQAGFHATGLDGSRRLRRGLAWALLPLALAAAWLAAADARASARVTNLGLELSADIVRLVAASEASSSGAVASPGRELIPSAAALATAPTGLAAMSPADLARLTGTGIVILEADSIVGTSRDLPASALAGLRAPAGRLRVGAGRHAYRSIDLAGDRRMILLAPPLEDSRKAVLFWLAGLYGLLAAGALIFASHARAASSAMELREAGTAWAFIAPSLVLLLVFTAAPLLFAFYLSFHGWNLLETAKPFVGLRHYVELAGDGLFWNAAKNTLVFSLYVPATMVLALGVALLLNRSMKGVALLRAVFFMPYITSFVALSIVWQWMYDPDFGLLNWALGLLGLGPFPWLSSPSTALLALIIMAIWIHIGFQMVIFLAGLQAIPQELYEAAVIDGAGPWRRFWRITLPLLRPTTFFVLVTSIIGSFQVFTFVYVMTEGGPLRATDVIVYHIYQNAWQFLRMGYASAMSWVLFAVILLITLLQFRLLGRRMTPY